MTRSYWLFSFVLGIISALVIIGTIIFNPPRKAYLQHEFEIPKFSLEVMFPVE